MKQKLTSQETGVKFEGRFLRVAYIMIKHFRDLLRTLQNSRKKGWDHLYAQIRLARMPPILF